MEIRLAEEMPLDVWRESGERVTGWPHSQDFLNWRLNMQHTRTFIAVKDNRIYGLLGAFPRWYMVSGERREILETLDWFADPEAGVPALGLALMQKMLSLRLPLLSVGGSEQNQALLPRLGFDVIGQVRTFKLPLSGLPFKRRFGSGFKGRCATVVGSVLARTLRKPRIPHLPDGVTAISTDGPSDAISHLYENASKYDFVRLPEHSHYRWIANELPNGGKSFSIMFETDGRVQGWASGRIWFAEGMTHAVIMDIFAHEPSLQLYTAIISTITSELAAHNPDEIRAASSCPMIAEAFHANRFWEGKSMPAFLHPNGSELQIEKPMLSLSRGDDGLIPFA